MDAIIPEGLWQLPLPVLLIALLSLGIFVTKREHSNMIKQMEYFRSLSETREKTIENLTETVVEFRELGKLVTKLITTVQELSEREGDDVPSSSKNH
jgi:hypothetical protein